MIHGLARPSASRDGLRIHAPLPRRIVCLTEETTETLYLLGAGDLVVGVSGYTARPPEARQKPKVSAFINARFDKILALDPDLVLAFSDLQADIAAELIRRGLTVVTFNQRSVADILRNDSPCWADWWDCSREAEALADDLERGTRRHPRVGVAASTHRPRVFFEEWDDPLISGIRWVEELVEVAGGAPMFPELSQRRHSRKTASSAADAVRERGAGHHPRVVVRQESAEGDDRRADRLGRRARRGERATSTKSSRPTSCSLARITHRRRPADPLPLCR